VAVEQNLALNYSPPELRLLLAREYIQQLYQELGERFSRAKEVEVDSLLEACELFAREQKIRIECENQEWILYPEVPWCELSAIGVGTCVRVGVKGKFFQQAGIVRSHVAWLHSESLPLGFDVGFVVEVAGTRRTFKPTELEVIPFVRGTQVAIIGEAGRIKWGKRFVLGMCACGQVKTFRYNHLTGNNSRCCGCLRGLRKKKRR
jgi:hypothetical protein